MDWQLAEAKNKLSAVVTRALTDGPQRIRRRDQVVVVVAEDEYQRLMGARLNFRDFLLNAPDLTDRDTSRDSGQMRDVAW